MKNTTRNSLTTIIFILVISFAVNAQTTISGGIFSNTTWTQANSPYIVVDTTVVFPGVTLTIEPGVTIKFNDHKYLDIRGILIATGTETDSITFTSNSMTPTAGIWGHPSGGVLLNNGFQLAINYWHVEYSTKGLSSGNYLSIKNSIFTNNLTGIDVTPNIPIDSCIFKLNETAIGNLNTTLNYCTISNNYYGIYYQYNSVLNNCTINSNFRPFGGATGSMNNTKFFNCEIRYNHDGIVCGGPFGGNLIQHCIIEHNVTFGIVIGNSSEDTIINNEIKYNGIGIQTGGTPFITNNNIELNTTGVAINSTGANISCNHICNNTLYNMQMHTSSNFSAVNNYWCSADSSQIAASINDGYDNVAYGLITFLPQDTLQCYLSTGIPNDETRTEPFRIFPNPVDEYLTLTISDDIAKAEINIFNLLGEIEYSSKNVRGKTIVDVSTLATGVYVLELMVGNKISRQKFIKVENTR